MSHASWNQYTSYVIGDSVSFSGLVYRALVPNRNVIPSSSSSIWLSTNNTNTDNNSVLLQTIQQMQQKINDLDKFCKALSSAIYIAPVGTETTEIKYPI